MSDGAQAAAIIQYSLKLNEFSRTWEYPRKILSSSLGLAVQVVFHII